MISASDINIENVVEKEEKVILKELTEAQELLYNTLAKLFDNGKKRRNYWDPSAKGELEKVKKIILDATKHNDMVVALSKKLLQDFATLRMSKWGKVRLPLGIWKRKGYKYGGFLLAEEGRVIGTSRHFKTWLNNFISQLEFVISLMGKENEMTMEERSHLGKEAVDVLWHVYGELTRFIPTIRQLLVFEQQLKQQLGVELEQK